MSQCKPWKQGDLYPNWVLDDKGEFVARCFDDSTAARIVREHNAHDNLVEAVKDLAMDLNSTPESGPVCWCSPVTRDPCHTPACKAIRAALTKAKEVKPV